MRHILRLIPGRSDRNYIFELLADKSLVMVRRVLVIDNDADYSRLITTLLDDPRGQCEVTVARTLGEGLRLLHQIAPHSILLELNLSDSAGYETFLRVREQAKGIPIIVLTSVEDDDLAAQAIQEGAQDYLLKSLIEPRLLAQSVRTPRTESRYEPLPYTGWGRNRIRLLLHSQDQRLQILLQPALGSDFEITVEPRRDRAKDLAVNGSCDVLVMDLDATRLERNISFWEELRSMRVPIVVMTDESAPHAGVEFRRLGIHGYFRKPPVFSELKIVIRRAYENGRLEHDLESIKQEHVSALGCDQLIGSSSSLRHVYDLVGRVAPLDAFVLITGESGTGKELIARAIHSLSERRLCPFLAVSCGAIPETLIEAELFGYEKGAFTGAVGSRKGYLEQAGRGTLFLDEIGELSPHTQVKLLRVLQERQFSRLGSSAVIPLEARILFATHRDLAKMVEDGNFRLDLYYRVNVMGIKAPPLREHSDDIPTLARHFLVKYSRMYKKPVSEIAPPAMALLMDYDWPGNVRELENLIQKAIILTDDGTIHPENLPDDLQQGELPDTLDTLPGGSFEERLRDYKLKLAHQAIEDCHGNKTLAARSLQISRTYLHRLIKEHVEEVEEVPSL